MTVSSVIDTGVSLLDGLCKGRGIAFIDPRKRYPVCLPNESWSWKETVVAFDALESATTFLVEAGSDADRELATCVKVYVVIPFLGSQFHEDTVPTDVLDACEAQAAQYRYTRENKGHYYVPWHSAGARHEERPKKQRVDRIVDWETVPTAFAHALEAALSALVTFRCIQEANAEQQRRNEFATEEMARRDAERTTTPSPSPPDVLRAICC